MELLSLPLDLYPMVMEYLWNDILDLYRASHRQLFAPVISELCPQSDMDELFLFFHQSCTDQRRLINRMYRRHGFRIFHWNVGVNLLERSYLQSAHQAWNHMRALGAKYSSISKHGFYVNKYSQDQPWHLDK